MTLRHYNDSAIIKAEVIKGASGQAFPVGTQKLHVVQAPRKIFIITAVLDANVQPEAIQGGVLGARDGWRAELARV